MDCPGCGARNEAGVGSCVACGAPLGEADAPTMMKPMPASKAPPGVRLVGNVGPPKQCPNCTTLNAASFKFCARCGTPLGGTATPAVASAGSRTPAQTGAAPARTPPAAPTAGSAAAAKPPLAQPASPRPTPAPPRPGAAQGRAPAATVSQAGVPRARARVSAIARDGSRSADFALVKEETRVGRDVPPGEVKLDQDPFVAPLHAVFRFEGQQLTVRDEGSANGVFVWLRERQLQSGDELRIGRQRLRVEWLPEEPELLADQPVWGSPDPGYTARVVQLLDGGGEGDVFPLKPGENLVGRGSGDVSFPQDGYVSSRHAMIAVGDGELSVKDLGSANGTFVRIHGSAPVNVGDLLLVGDQILRVDPP